MIREFTSGCSYDDYVANAMMRGAVERKFEIMGEALNRIRKKNPEMLGRIRECREIISFRNILIHGYDIIDDRIVWAVIQEDLDNLIEDAEHLLA
ncbi:MAG TPA: DUF86 domain-containing protein [Kiritimatiellia bacterium]|nr:DUF86 domain-containing protein [Kiritimatiellia bacterium]